MKSSQILQQFRQFNMNFLKKPICQFLQAVDLFGAPVHFFIKGHTEFHTVLGSFTSLAIIGLLFNSFLLLLVNYIDKNNPTVTTSLVFNPNPAIYEVPPNDFLIASAITDENAIPLKLDPQNQIITVLMHACYRSFNPHLQRSVTRNCTSMVFKPCAQIDNEELSNRVRFDSLLRSYSLCVDPKDLQSQVISLEGIQTSRTLRSITLEVLPCQEELFPKQCASPEKINATLDQSYIGMFLTDTLLNQQQKGNPFTSVIKSIATPFTNRQFKSTLVNFRKATLKDEDQQYTALQFEKIEVSSENSPRRTILEYNIIFDDKEVFYYRSYSSLIEILGAIGGIFELLRSLASLIVKPLNRILYDAYVYNHVADRLASKRVSSEKCISPVKQAKDGFFTYLKTAISYFTAETQSKLYQYQQKIDVVRIIKKQIEFDNLIDVLFDPTQLKLFQALYLNSGEEAYESYKQIQSAQNKSQLDYRLLSLVEPLVKSQMEMEHQNCSQLDPTFTSNHQRLHILQEIEEIIK